MKRTAGRKYVRAIIIAFFSVSICTILATGRSVVTAALGKIDIILFYRVRFEVLAQSPKGQYYINLYDTYTGEVVQILINHPTLAIETDNVLMTWQPNLDAFVNGRGDEAVITDEQVRAVFRYLDHLAQWASPELKSAINTERSVLSYEKTVGMTMNQGWVYFNQDARFPPASDPLSTVSVSPPKQISNHLATWTLPEYPRYSIDFDPDVWELLSWNNGLAASWEFANYSVPGCVVTIPRAISDPYTGYRVENKFLGNYQYESRASDIGKLTLYVLYKPLNLPAVDSSGSPDQKDMFFIVYPGYEDGIGCIAQSEDLLGNLRLSDTH